MLQFHCPLVIKRIYYGKTLVLETENTAFHKTNGVPLNAITELKAWFCNNSTFLHRKSLHRKNVDAFCPH